MSAPKLPKKPKVNFPIQWIFLLVIGLVLVYQFMDMPGGPKEIGSSEFKRDFLDKGKVKKIVIVKLDEKLFVEAYLSDSILNTKEVKADKKVSKNGPQYTFDISSADGFMKEIDTYNVAALPNHTVLVDNENREHSFLESISGILLMLGIMAVFWIFMMRRMGGGGGPGGQIFNIGKSRATLFD